MAGLFVFIAVAVILAFVFYYVKKDNIKDKPNMKFKDDPGISGLSTEEMQLVYKLREESKQGEKAVSSAPTVKKAETPDKVICTHCDSYVDIDENEICPNCGASIKEEIDELNRKKKSIEAEYLFIQAEMEKDRKQNEKNLQIANTMKSASLNLLLPGAGTVVKKFRSKK